MKRVITTILYGAIILMISCQTSFPKEICLTEQLGSIVDSFTNKYPDKAIYELYIKRIDPHYSESFLFAGDGSRTQEEIILQSQYPLFYTKSNNKKVWIFSGIERYIKNDVTPDIESSYAIPNNKKEGVIWIIKHRFDTIEVIDKCNYVYPFMPLPINIDFINNVESLD